MESRTNTAVKWLRLLLWLHVAILVIPLLTYLTPNDSWAAWFKHAISAATAFSLFHLALRRYRTAAVLRSVLFVLAMVNLGISACMTRLLAAQQLDENAKVLLNMASLFSGTAQLILTYPAAWMEQSGHAELIAGQDAALAKRWRKLLLWQFLAAVLVSVSTGIATQLAVQFQWRVTGLFSVVYDLLRLPTKLANVLYILFMYRTIRLVEQVPADTAAD